MHYLKQPFITLFLVLVSTLSYGQRYNFEHYDIEDGLVQSQVTAITQDKQNRLWIATMGGLSCFNGTQFTNLAKTNGLNSNLLLSMTLNSQGNLLIGTENGISIYKGDSLYRYTSLTGWANELVSTLSGSLYGLSGKNIFKVTGTKTIPVYVTGDSTEIVTALKTDYRGKTWAAVYQHGLYFLEGNIWRRKIAARQVRNLIITDILIDRLTKDKIWLLSMSGIYIAEKGAIKRVFTKTIKKATAIHQDEDGNLWLGTNKGAWFISADQQIHFDVKNGFTDNLVTRIFRDRENNIWLGTNGSGIFKFNSKSYVTYDESQGLQNSIVMSIVNGPEKDEIWLGTYDGIFVHKNDKIRKLTIPSALEESRHINCLFKDSSGRIWVGTAGGGLWIYKNGKFKRIDKGNHAVASNTIMEDRHKNIWISTNFGCFLLDHATNKTSQIAQQFNNSLLEISSDIIIAGGRNGAYLIRNKKVTAPLKIKPIAETIVLSMLKHRDDIYFGTADNGLVIWNISTGKIKQLNTKDGLFSDHVYSLLLDKKGIIWVGTGRGINKIGPKDFSILKNENNLMVECNQNAILEGKDKIWIGTTKGALVFTNSHDTSAVNQPFIFMNTVSILAQNNRGSQNTTYTTYKPYELNKGIVLPYNHNHLNINFTGIYMTNPKAVMYQYRLKGLDDKFSRPNLNSSVNYTALPPGKYTFQVKAVTASGIASKNIAAFNLEITPPYYQTTTFKVVILILIILSILISVYIIINLNERQRKLRLRIKLEEQFKIRKQTAEDFHDDLGNKLTRISVLSEVLSSMTDKNDHEKRAIIHKIKTNVNELYNGTKDILWSLNPKNDSLGELLAHIKEFGYEMFNDTQVHFHDETFVTDLNKRLSLEMSRNMLMIFKEAINNALKYSKGNQVIFTANVNNHILDLQLRDNGTGFDPTFAKHGHGINNMQVRASRIKGNLNITSTYKGTTVALSVKL